MISAVDRGAQGPISNVALIKRADAGDEFEAVCKATPIGPLGIVFGWCVASTLDGGATPHVDTENDAVVGDDELIRCAAEFMENGGPSDVLHDNIPDGRVLFLLPLTSDVCKALGIKSDVHGLAIGMKPSPETLARFLSKELDAFSIYGVGEREPVEKSMSVVTYEGPSQAAPSGRGRCVFGDVSKFIADELPDDTERVRIARLNPTAEWAAEWIEKGIEMDKQADITKQATEIEKQRAAVEITIEKSTSLVKSLIAKRQTTLDAHDAYVAKVARERKLSVSAAMSALINAQDAEYAKLYAEHSVAHDGVCRAAEHIAAPKVAFITKQIDDATAKLREAEESFCLAHNLEPHAAQDRLQKISPSYRELYEKSYRLQTERDTARLQAKAMTQEVHAQMAGEAAAADVAAAETNKRASESPANRTMREHVERYAKANNLAYPVAFTKAMDDDATTRSLYELVERERMRRAS